VFPAGGKVKGRKRAGCNLRNLQNLSLVFLGWFFRPLVGLVYHYPLVFKENLPSGRKGERKEPACIRKEEQGTTGARWGKVGGVGSGREVGRGQH
jgi:hypothetical protein